VPALRQVTWLTTSRLGIDTSTPPPHTVRPFDHARSLIWLIGCAESEEGVGRAIRASGIPRSEIFITTKLYVSPSLSADMDCAHDGCRRNSQHHEVAAAFETSLRALDCEYIDLYLMHWPQAEIDGALFRGCGFTSLIKSIGRTLQPEESPTIVDTWLAMEKLLESGTAHLCPSRSLAAHLVHRKSEGDRRL
jgi:diketogulonate reductase-like aldo/keto reductase